MSTSAESQPQSQSQTQGQKVHPGNLLETALMAAPDLMLSGFYLRRVSFRVRTRRRGERETRFKRYHDNVPALSHL